MPALGRLDVVAIDCNDPEPLVAFWCAVLGTTVRSRAADWVALHLDVNVDDLDDRA